MTLYKLSCDINKKQTLTKLGIDKGALSILKNKMDLHLIKIDNLHVAAANILKQDALSIGADVATPKGVITCDVKYVDVILIATSKQLKILSKKELAQPFGLKDVASKLSSFINTKNDEISIMGVINANDDSFFKQSRFQKSDAIIKIKQMIEDGAGIIDIGGVSSRPGSQAVSDKEELNRVKDIIDLIHQELLYEKVPFSIDSYNPLVIEYALKHGFTIINDITGLADNKVCELAFKYKAKVIIMHMQGSPEDMQKAPHYDNVITEVTEFFLQRIQKAKEFDIEDIVLDIGIGFGKTLEHNLTLLKHLEHFKSLGYPLLVGASRKSMIDHIKPTSIEERLPATLSLHIEALQRGASIIRCHDVKEHAQAFSITQALRDS